MGHRGRHESSTLIGAPRLVLLRIAPIAAHGRLLVGIVLAASAVWVMTLPSTTTRMVNYVPENVSTPLYVKAVAFIHRDLQMREIMSRAAGDARDAERIADSLLSWTRANVRPTPTGMPIIDDHPYDVIVRGYGEYDQAADVFATLAGYAGIPGGLVFARGADGSALYAFAVLEIAGAPRVFDVREGRAFRDRTGALITLDRLRADPGMLDAIPPPASGHGLPYSMLISNLESGPHRRPSDQMPLSRLFSELGRAIRR